MDIFDEIPARPTGDVMVRGMANGKPLADPLSIFKYDADRARLRNRVVDGWVDVDANLVVDNGRQVLAYLLGGKNWNSVTPNRDYIVSSISFGGYDEVPRFTDQTLSPQGSGANEIEVSAGVYKKPLESVDWPAPFIVRFEGRLETSEANSTTIREFGLWAGSEASGYQLIARKTTPAISKSSDISLSILWRIRV
jgi:hypothetical protein